MPVSKTEALRKAVKDRLGAAGAPVYYAQANEDTVRPYMVYSLETVTASDDMEIVELEANCMDYGKDTAECEALADQVERLFDKWYHLDDQIQISTYLDRRQPVFEEDRRVIRRRLLIEIHLTERRDK